MPYVALLVPDTVPSCYICSACYTMPCSVVSCMHVCSAIGDALLHCNPTSKILHCSHGEVNGICLPCTTPHSLVDAGLLPCQLICTNLHACDMLYHALQVDIQQLLNVDGFSLEKALLSLRVVVYATQAWLSLYNACMAW